MTGPDGTPVDAPPSDDSDSDDPHAADPAADPNAADFADPSADPSAQESAAEVSDAENPTADGATAPTGQPGQPGQPRTDQPDFEGPRRRARREREERRAAQARALAIEDARRAAKRRATGAAPADAPARGLIRGLRALMWSALASVVAVTLGLLLYFTPIMAVRSTEITGLVTLTADEVNQVAAVAPGTPLLQVDTDVVADRVATIRRVASARVQREYPSTLRITVVERVALVVKDFPDGPHLFDADGVDFASAPPPPGLPYLDVDAPGPGDPPTKAALQVMTALRPEVSSQISRIAAPSVAAITLTLLDGRQVVWGTTDRTEEKALKLGALLTQPGHVYDVSSPDLPTVK